MLDFLKQLFESGEITVPRQVPDDLEPVRRLLIFVERIWRQEWPGPAPRFDADRAAQAAAVLCAFCRAAVYRELDEQTVAEELKHIGLQSDTTDDSASTYSASVHYSVDLVLRFLPLVYERLSRTSQDDPMLALAFTVARQWPLSSVGIPDSAPDSLPTAFDDRGLFQVYVDRVLESGDRSRMNVAEVSSAVAEAVGPYDGLQATYKQLLPTNEHEQT